VLWDSVRELCSSCTPLYTSLSAADTNTAMHSPVGFTCSYATFCSLLRQGRQLLVEAFLADAAPCRDGSQIMNNPNSFLPYTAAYLFTYLGHGSSCTAQSDNGLLSISINKYKRTLTVFISFKRVYVIIYSQGLNRKKSCP
jgi:hypothetical protein